MDAAQVKDFRAAVEAQLFGHILPFWTGPALDQEHGGWVPWMSNDLKVDHSRPQGLILNSRTLWAFSAVHRERPEKLYAEMADRAFEIILHRFWDREFGGAFWRLDASGRALEDSKKIYGQAFCIYALTEYALAFGSAQAHERARELFELLERHAHEPAGGGYWEVCRRNWAESADSRLSEKDMNEKKSMNNHLHVLEAYTNLYRTWKEPRLAQRLRELIDIFQGRILDQNTGHLHHFFDEHWRVRSTTYTFGHDIEASWLLCEAAEVLGDPAVAQAVRPVALRLAETALVEGLGADGGLCYEGKDGQWVDTGKECWPQAEAVVGFLNAWQIAVELKFFEAAQRVWTYLEEHLVDRVHGEWFWRINPDGRPDASLPKVSEWKGPYHGTRACLEALRRLRQIQPCEIV